MKKINSYIDCHTHLLPKKRSRKLIEWAKKFMPSHPVDIDSTTEDLIQDLEQAGAEHYVSLYYPLWPEEAPALNRFGADLAKSPRITAFGGVHLKDQDPLAIVKQAIEEFGMAGLKFHPMVQRFSPAQPELRPIYPYLNQNKKALYMHTGYDEWYGWTLPPEDVEWIIKEHPDMGVVLSHSGFPRIDWAFKLARKFPNVWLDTTNVFGSMAMIDKFGQQAAIGSYQYEDLAKSIVSQLPDLADRTFFGTDHPAGIGDINQILTDLQNFGLDEKTKNQILLQTPKAFLNKFGNSTL